MKAASRTPRSPSKKGRGSTVPVGCQKDCRVLGLSKVNLEEDSTKYCPPCSTGLATSHLFQVISKWNLLFMAMALFLRAMLIRLHTIPITGDTVECSAPFIISMHCRRHSRVGYFAF